MDRPAQLQFASMAPEAQRSAIRRLALRGFDDFEIAAATGWTPERIREVLSPPEPVEVPIPAIFKNRRSGSTGGPAN